MKKLMVTLLAAVAGLSYVAAVDVQQAPDEETLKVMSFNIRQSGVPEDGANGWNYRKVPCVAMIRDQKPDLIGMQEVLAEQSDYLTERLTEYGKVGLGRDDGKREGEQMSVFYRLDRFELADSGHFWLSETPDEVSCGWDGACNRMCTWIGLKERQSGKTVYLFNTHLDHMGPVARKEGALLLVAKIKEIAGRNMVFLTGDFNANPDDLILVPLFKKFGSARDKAPVTDRHGTFNGWGNAPSNIILDYIFYQKASPVEFQTITKGYGCPFISDHYPIIATFKW